jgi:hypothetical protein
MTLAIALLALTLAGAPQSGPPPQQGGASPTVSPTDIQRLQDLVYDVGRDLSALRARGDVTFAGRLDDELGDLRDEVIYLKVKVRKEGRVSRNEYADLRDRLEDLRARARGDLAQGRPPVYRQPPPPQAYPPPQPAPQPAPLPPPPAQQAPLPPPPPQPVESVSGRRVPVGQELDVRLQTALSSGTAQVEDRFEATTLVDVRQGDDLFIPAGSVVRGIVRSVQKAGRIERKGSMTLAFDQLTIDGRPYPMRATVVQAIESEGVRGEAGKIGTAAGVGAIIGGILGGFKGALAGVLIGGGGTVAATQGTDVKLDPGTILRIRFDAPLDLDTP